MSSRFKIRISYCIFLAGFTTPVWADFCGDIDQIMMAGESNFADFEGDVRNEHANNSTFTLPNTEYCVVEKINQRNTVHGRSFTCSWDVAEEKGERVSNQFATAIYDCLIAKNITATLVPFDAVTQRALVGLENSSIGSFSFSRLKTGKQAAFILTVTASIRK